MNLDYVSRIKFGLKRYKMIATDKATSRVLDGSYNSIYKGRSMNFDELREYVPGDDIKDIDWKATSRSQKVLIRQYIAEKKHNIMLVMDTNRRMLAETKAGEVKGDVALMAGGTLAYMVTDNGDYVSGLYYNNEKMERSPFKTGFLNLEFLLEGYAKCLKPDNKSDLNGILKYMMNYINRRMIIVIVTDLEGICSLSDSLLNQITMVHDVLLIRVSDTDIFGKKVYNVEGTGYLPPFISTNKSIQKKQKKIVQDMEKTAETKLNRHGIPTITVDSEVRVDGRIAELLEKNKVVN
ncbi:DUF58 domain-containing protein [Butyrivibrio sp. AE2032]|uniref:DUF58 domain-containing protein n=1 Tax=Butyrivibrio sp. AE2032 TaxID=1458463 RepID=UPI000556D30B|nr:DUF58 domain-containing protein [Butyrivibrio sp. AE2032]